MQRCLAISNLIRSKETTFFNGATQKSTSKKRSVINHPEIHGGVLKANQQTKKSTLFYQDKKTIKTDYDTYISLGPLTNSIQFKKIRENVLYIMGGVLALAGNANKTAEANFFWDPDAVYKTFQLNHDSIILFPLNITHPFNFKIKKILSYLDNSFLKKWANQYESFYAQEKKEYFDGRKICKFRGGCYHDLLVTICAFFPQSYKKQKMKLYLAKDGSISLMKNRNQYPVSWDIEVVTQINYTEILKKAIFYLAKKL